MIFFPCPVISLDSGHHHQGVLQTSKHKGTVGTENAHVLLSYRCPKAHVQLLQKVSLPKGSHFFLFYFLLLVHLQLHYHQTHPDPRLFQATAGEEVKLISAGVEH